MTRDVREGPHPVDAHVGARIRERRKEMGVNQERLAAALSVTFQQVQKYELGNNRVSASKLWEIANVLGTPVAYFYEGLEIGARESNGNDATRDILGSEEWAELVAAFPRIAEPSVRRKFLELIRAAAGLS